MLECDVWVPAFRRNILAPRSGYKSIRLGYHYPDKHDMIVHYCVNLKSYATELYDFNYKPGRAMAQALSRRPLTAEARVHSHDSPWEICGRQSGTGTGFSPSTSVFIFNFIPPVLHYTEK